MTTYNDVLGQLSKLGLKFRFFGRAEIRELANVLNPDETIYHCVYGNYEGGSGLLVATDRRLLLIDKRPLSLNFEDIRYETIVDVYFAVRIFNASVKLYKGSKLLEFTTFSDARLRKLCVFTQDQITKSRMDRPLRTSALLETNAWDANMGRPRVSHYTGRLIAHKLLGH